jgi:hypothetical protein
MVTSAFTSPAGAGSAALGLLFCLGATPPALAQHRLRVGLQSGLHLSTYLGGEAGRRARLVPGLTAGVVASWHWSARQGLQVEARYAQKGATQPDCAYLFPNAGPAALPATYRSRLAYLDVPVLYTWGPGSSGPGLYGLAGPQISFALGRREWVRPAGGAPGSPAEIDLPAARRALLPVTAGLVGGLGYQLANSLGLEVRVSGDLTPVFRAGRGPDCLPASGADCRNAVVQVQLRYLFKGRSAAGAVTERPTAVAAPHALPPPNWHPRWASPGPPLPGPAPLDSLYQDPRFQRALRILSVLSWLHVEWSPGPARPAPRPLPWPTQPASRPLPRRGPERVPVP